MKLSNLLLFFVAIGLSSTVVSAQTDTTIFYQGQLFQNGNPTSGSFNMTFELWDDATTGSQIGATISLNGIQVVDGHFNAELDFGANAFDNTNRWMQIAVNGTDLDPRQLVSRTPYAIQTRGIFVADNYNVGIGTLTPRGNLEVANFFPGGAGTIGVAANGSAGGLAAFSNTFLFPNLADRMSLFSDASEASGLDLRADGEFSDMRFYTGGFEIANERMRITDAGRVGIGTDNPIRRLQVESDDSVATIWGNNSQAEGPGIGVQGTAASILGRGVKGQATAEAGFTVGVEGISSSPDGAGVIGRASSATGATTGVEGLTDSDQGIGVKGHATSTDGGNDGVLGRNDSNEGRGVRGVATSLSGNTFGVVGRSDSFDGTGVYGSVMSGSGETYGVHGLSTSFEGRGLFGQCNSDFGRNYGVYGESRSTTGVGVYGHTLSPNGQTRAVWGDCESADGYDFLATGFGMDYGSFSSRRWKSNIEQIDQPLELISRLQGVYFDWNQEHGGQHDIGMIAEDVGRVLPEIVQYEENGTDAEGMDYSRLTPLLVEAVKALHDKQQTHAKAHTARVAKLEAENESLRARNDALQDRLDSLEQLVAQLAEVKQEQPK